MPSEVPRMVALWKAKCGDKAGQSLADPTQYPNLFPGYEDALKAEAFLEQSRKRGPLKAKEFPNITVGILGLRVCC